MCDSGINLEKARPHTEIYTKEHSLRDTWHKLPQCSALLGSEQENDAQFLVCGLVGEIPEKNKKDYSLGNMTLLQRSN